MANPIDINKEFGELKKFNEELAKTAAITGKLLADSKKLTTELGKTKGLSDQNKKRTAAQTKQNEVEKVGNSLLKQRNTLLTKQDPKLRAITKDTIKQNEKVKEQNRLYREQAKADLGIKKRNGLFKSMTKSLIATGAAMLTLGTAIRVVAGSFKTIAGFERGMAKVRAVTNATSGAFIALNANAQKLGASTSKSASQVAGLQLEFSKLGFSTKEILAATEATISLSIAAGSDLANSAVVAASTVRGFGLTADDTQRVVDVMAKSFASSALDMEKFKTAMAAVAPVAKANGKNIEFTTARLSTLTDAGLDASTAGTSLRNMFLNLSKEGLTWEEGLEKINSAQDKNVAALDLFGKRGATAALVLAENIDKSNKLEKSYNNAAGAAKRMADIMEDDIIGEADKFKSALEGLILSLNSGDGAISKMSRGIIKLGTNLLGALTSTEKESEALQRMKIEMNANLDAIKNQELPLKIRQDLIEKVNTQYKDYLPNLIDEKTSLEDIEAIQVQANVALLENIRIKAQREILDEQINKIAKLGVEIAREQIRVEKLKAGEISFTASAYLSQEEQISGLEVSIKRLINEYQGEVEELNKIQSIFDTLNPKQEENTDIVIGNTKAVKDQVSTYKETALALKLIESGLVEFTKEVEDEKFNIVQANINKSIAANKAKLDQIELDEKASEEKKKALRDAAINTIASGANTLFDLAQSQRDRELEGVRSNYAAQIEAAGENTALKERLAKDLARKEAEIQRQQAQSERNQALFNIALSTAQGIAKTIATLGLPAAIPFIALTGALGAIQTAAVLSQPLPEIPGFFKGTESAPAGLAHIAERGAELLTMPSGESMLVNNPSLMNLEAGTKVKTAEQTQDILNKAIYNDIAVGGNGAIDTDRIVRAISNQPKEVTTFDDDGIKRYLSKGNSITNYQNRRARGL